MSFTISGVTYDDVPSVVKNNMLALHRSNPRWRALFGSKPLDEIIRDSTARMPHVLASGREKKRHIKAVDDATGKVVGYARWVLPDGDDRIDWPEARVPEPEKEEADRFKADYQANTEAGATPGVDQRLLAAIAVPFYQAEEEAMDPHEGPFLVLDFLAVHPDHRLKGVASALVRKGLEQADSVGMKVWAKATMTAQSMYKNLGFEPVQTVETSVAEFGIEEPDRKIFLMRR